MFVLFAHVIRLRFQSLHPFLGVPIGLRCGRAYEVEWNQVLVDLKQNEQEDDGKQAGEEQDTDVKIGNRQQLSTDVLWLGSPTGSTAILRNYARTSAGIAMYPTTPITNMQIPIANITDACLSKPKFGSHFTDALNLKAFSYLMWLSVGQDLSWRCIRQDKSWPT